VLQISEKLHGDLQRWRWIRGVQVWSGKSELLSMCWQAGSVYQPQSFRQVLDIRRRPSWYQRECSREEELEETRIQGM
jgi:hypothetical protein